MSNIKKFLLIIVCFITLPAIAANVIIDADKQSYDYKTNTVNFTGNVNVKMDDITVTSPKAQAVVDKNGQLSNAVFTDGAYAVQDNVTTKNEIKANIINMSLLTKKVKAEGNVVSIVNESNKPLVTISSDVQEFDTKTNIMDANGNVRIDYKGIKTNSQEAHISVDEDGNLTKVNLVGNGHITRENHTIQADDFVFEPATNIAK